jgi:GABA permease
MNSLGGLIGAGLFVGTGTAIAVAGPAIIVSYAVAGLILLFVRHFMADLRYRVPSASLLSDFVHAGLGTSIGSVAQRIYGCFWLMVAAIDALAGANILAPMGGTPRFLASIGLLVATATLGKQLSAFLSRFEFALALVKVIAIVGFIVLLACHLLRGHPPAPAPQSFTPWITSSHRAAEVFSGVVIALFSLAGPEVGLIAPWALISSRVLAIYIVPIALILSVIRADAILPGFSPFTLALGTINDTLAARCLDLVILLGVIKVANTALATSARVLGRKDTQCLTSLRLLSAALAVAALCLAAHWPANAYAFLVEGAGVLLLVVYILFILAAAKLRPVMSTLPSGCRRCLPYMLIALLALALQSMAWVRGLGTPFVVALGGVVLATLVDGMALFCRSPAPR